MTLKTGNKTILPKQVFLSQQGLTFIEVMIALVIFSFGIVSIFRSFIYSLDRTQYVSHRLYAAVSLDNQVEKIKRLLKVYQALPMQLQERAELSVGKRIIPLSYTTYFDEVEDFLNIFELNLKLTWQEKNRTVGLNRSCYIADFSTQE